MSDRREKVQDQNQRALATSKLEQLRARVTRVDNAVRSATLEASAQVQSRKPKRGT